MNTVSRETGLNPWFVTGFCEGAAQFTFSRSGAQVSLYFALKVDPADQRLLAELRAFFDDGGRVYETRPGKLYFRITRAAELVKVVAHFEAFPLQGAKDLAYRTWREMLEHKLEANRRPDPQLLERLARKLSKGTLPAVETRSLKESPQRFVPEVD